MANPCLMANDVQETKLENLDEIDYSNLLEYSKDELAQALIRCIQCEEEYLSKIKTFKKTIHNLFSEKEVSQRENDDLYLKIEHLEKGKQEVQSKCGAFEKLALKFTKGQDNLDKLLGSQRMSFNKEGIGYNPLNKKKAYKNFFIKETPKNKSHISYNYCLRNKHISYSCPLRKTNIKVIQVWVTKGTRPKNMVKNNVGVKPDAMARKV